MKQQNELYMFEQSFINNIENSPISIIITGGNHIVKYISSSAERILNIRRVECVGEILSECMPFFNDFDNDEKSFNIIQVLTKKLQVFTFQLRELNGEIDHAYLLIDIHENSLIKEELKCQRNMLDELQEILEGSYDGILVTDGEGEVLFVNSSYERITEIKRKDIYGKNMKDLINPVWMPNSVAFVAIEQRCTVSKKQVTKSGRSILVTGRPVFDGKGKIKKVVINARDISEIYELREELLKSQKIGKMYLQSFIDHTENTDSEVPNMLATSPKMQEVMALAEKVSNFQATVLILGESGVGKEEVAKYMNRCSIRKDKPFVTINCGAIPENLLESELFGYEKGAFTGAALTGKEGLLEIANGGVAFLDEIGETSLDFQVKLLRVLETKEIRRVGGVSGKMIDVRIVAATNRDLEQMVAEGTFREDLFYRLNVVRINVPPLRKRVEDIVPLSMLFLAKFNKAYSQCKVLTYDVIKELEKYSWPGNVRELKNVIENMVVVSNNEYLQIEDLPWNIDSRISSNKKIINTVAMNEEMSLQESLDALEKIILENARDKFKNTRQMADYLRVNQSTIVRKLQKYGISN